MSHAGPRMGLVVAGTVLALATILVSPAHAEVTTLYVDQGNPQCSDNGEGTQAQPYCTIKKGGYKAVAGQTVLVFPGVYNEKVDPAFSGTAGAPIAFKVDTPWTVSVTGQSHGFVISSKSWILVLGFIVTGTTGDGIQVLDSSHIAIVNNHVTHAGQPAPDVYARGIRLSNTTASVVSGNVTDHNTEAGIYLSSNATGNTITRNLTSYNARQYTRAAPGIDVRTTGNVVSDNVSHDNEDSGLQFYTGAANNTVVDNVSYRNGDHGIDDLAATGQVIVGNTVYQNVTAGINLEGGSTGGTLANNISVDNGVNSPRTSGNVRVDTASIPGTSLDFDLLFLHSGGRFEVTWGTTLYYTLAAFQAATQQESHGQEADPRWEGADTGDFALLAQSPAIDAANSGAPGEPATDAAANPRVDDPATKDRGVGPRTYDDLGAYEYQP